MKNLNELSNLQNVKAPKGLKEKTLAAAREVREEEWGGKPQHLTPKPRRGTGPMKRILAAVCAFGVIIGGTAFWRTRDTGQPVGDAVAETIMNSFGFAAYAADTGEVLVPKNSKIVFDGDGGCDDLEKGFFSGCLFKVTGENIKSISANIDKGYGIYRAKRLDISDEECTEYYQKGEVPRLPEMKDADEIMISSLDEKAWWADTCWLLGGSFENEAYDPDASYGFWAPPETPSNDPNEDLQQAWHSRVDTFEGATLTVTVTFTDNTKQTQTVNLHTGKLAVEYVDNVSGPHATGEVYDTEGDPGKPYVYGVYGDIAQTQN